MYLKYFVLISMLCVLCISGFSFAMDLDGEQNQISIQVCRGSASSDEDPESLRATINGSIEQLVGHHQQLLKGDYVTGWISYKTTKKGDERDQLFLENLDEGVLYPKGILPTFGKRCFNFLSQAWWGGINGAASGAYLPIILVAGGALFNFIPDNTYLVFIPLALMTPSFMHQGVKLAESMRQFVDPRGLKSTKPRGLKVFDLQETQQLLQERKITDASQFMARQTELAKDTEPYLLSHKTRNFCRILSLSFSIWENWKYAVFFWYIERYTPDTRLWRSIFLPSYIIQSIAKDYNYFMNYFEKENTKSENKAFNNPVNLEKKKVLLDRLRITRHLINGPGSDVLVDAMHHVLEERKNKIELSITVDDALALYGSDSETRNKIIHEAIFKYVKKTAPKFNERWEGALHKNIDILLEAGFFDGELVFDNREAVVIKVYNFIKEKMLYFAVQNAFEKTLKNKRPSWSDELKEAVYRYLKETKDGETNAFEARCAGLKKDLDQYSIGLDVFMTNMVMDNAQIREKEKFFEDFTESAVSLFLPHPKEVPLKSTKEESNLFQTAEYKVMKDLKSQSSKSTVKPMLQEVSKVSLSFNSLVRFISTFWASKLVFELMGVDPTASFYMSMVLSGLDSVFGIIKNWYPHQQDFADIRNINSQRDFKYLRLGTQISVGVVPAVFATMAMAGMVWTELGTSTPHWLIYVLLARGLPSELMSQLNFFGTQAGEIVTSVVTSIPVPACLQTAQNRAILNKDLKTTEETIERLAEPSTERFYDIWSKNAMKNLDY